MYREILIKANKEIKKSRPLLAKNIVCDAFRNGTFLEIAFMSKRCKNDASGSCIMCDYGAVNGVKSSETYLKEMDSILQKENGIQYLLLCSNGSIMDPSQISEATFCKILEHTNRTAIPNIMLETHYLDVTTEKLDLIRQLLNSKNVTIELGMETANQIYQDSLIMKHIDMKLFEKDYFYHSKLWILCRPKYFIRAPVLVRKEQFQDTQKSISWAFKHGCNPVVFPVNIKPYTLLMNMYENGYYKPVSHWLLLLLLYTIEPEQLSRITISYYGNRDENYYSVEDKTIFPDCCPICKKPLMDFYDAFSREDDPLLKRELLNRILEFDKCDCLKKQKEQLDLSDGRTFKEKYEAYSEFLKGKSVPVV